MTEQTGSTFRGVPASSAFFIDAVRAQRRTTFGELAVGAKFRFPNHGSAEYVKLDARRYQLLRADGTPVRELAYDLGWRGGTTDAVVPS